MQLRHFEGPDLIVGYAITLGCVRGHRACVGVTNLSLRHWRVGDSLKCIYNTIRLYYCKTRMAVEECLACTIGQPPCLEHVDGPNYRVRYDLVLWRGR